MGAPENAAGQRQIYAPAARVSILQGRRNPLYIVNNTTRGIRAQLRVAGRRV